MPNSVRLPADPPEVHRGPQSDREYHPGAKSQGVGLVDGKTQNLGCYQGTHHKHDKYKTQTNILFN